MQLADEIETLELDEELERHAQAYERGEWPEGVVIKIWVDYEAHALITVDMNLWELMKLDIKAKELSITRDEALREAMRMYTEDV